MNCSSTQSQWRLQDLLPALALLFFGLGAVAYAMLLPRGESSNFAILLKPWAGISDVIALVNETDAQIISINEPLNILIVHAARSDAVSAFYDAGAWMVFEPSQLSSCFDLKVPEA